MAKKGKKREIPIDTKIMKAYACLEQDISYGVRIDDLFRKTERLYPDTNFNEFEQSLLRLIHQYIGEVVPSEGVSKSWQKVIYDPRMQKYFHYVKIKLKTPKCPVQKKE